MSQAGERQMVSANQPFFSGGFPEYGLAGDDGLLLVRVKVIRHFRVSELHGVRVHNVAPEQYLLLS